MRTIVLAVVLVSAGCRGNDSEPPPPVSSATLPHAPPRATGALAAGRESAMPKTGALTEPEPESEDGSEEPIVPAPAHNDDGGMPL